MSPPVYASADGNYTPQANMKRLWVLHNRIAQKQTPQNPPWQCSCTHACVKTMFMLLCTLPTCTTSPSFARMRPSSSSCSLFCASSCC